MYQRMLNFASSTQRHLTTMTVPIRPIAVSMGEPAGIGTETLLKLFSTRSFESYPRFYLIDDITRIQKLTKTLGYTYPVYAISSPLDVLDLPSHVFPVFHIDVPYHPHFPHPKPHHKNTEAIIFSISQGIQHIKKGEAAALTTLPIDKHVLHQGGFSFPGHTEFLATFSQTPKIPLMVLSSPTLRTYPLTGHIALKDIFHNISHDRIVRNIFDLHQQLQERFNIPSPRLAIAGLNPHAGENGDMGTEEQTILIPALKTLKERGISITGPLAADTLFTEDKRKTYDIAICLYHDQALIPVKTIAFDHCANITLNIPFIRTSPDHGVAFDIAGSNKARDDSLLYALQEAKRLSSSLYLKKGSFFYD